MYYVIEKLHLGWTPEQIARMVLLEDIKTYPPQLALPLNLVVLGTVNVDETTYLLSPKVLDRAFVVQFPTADWSRISGGSSSKPGDGELIPVPADWVHRLAEMDLASDIAQESEELWKTLSLWQAAYLKPLGIDCSYRLAMSFSQFMKIGYHGLSLEPKQVASAFTQMRILPRLAFTREESAVGQPGRHKIAIYKQWCEDKSLNAFPGLADVLRAMDERSPGPVLQFWQ